MTSNWPTAQLGSQLRKGEQVAIVLRSIGIQASVRQEGRQRYHVTATLDAKADSVPSAHWHLAIMEMLLSGITVSEVYQQRADWLPEDRVIGVDFIIEGEPKIKVPWAKVGGSSSPPKDAPKRIDVAVSEAPRQPVKVICKDDVSTEASPTLYTWPSAFWFVRDWPMFAPVSPYRM